MAIFHLSVKTFSRAKAQSAVAAAAYRAGERLIDERVGEVKNYRPRGAVLRDEGRLILPPGAPAWSREKVWNQAEAAENRKNSTVAREVEVSLPAELDRADRVRLAHDFGKWLSDEYGVAADVQIHEPTPKHDDPRNFHSHILLSTRQLTPDGFGQKTRILDDKKTGPEQVELMRKEWADRVNRALEFRGIEERIDHRSNARRGIECTPTIHVGRGAGAASRAEFNDSVKALNTELKDLLAERAQIVAQEAAKAAQERAEADFKTFRATVEKQRQDGERAAAAPAMTLEQITANARAKIAARRAAEAAAAPIDQAERRQRRAEKLAAKTTEKRDQVQAQLVAAVDMKPKAADRADVEEARAKIKEYEQAKPKAEKSLADAEKNLDTIRRAPMPAPWNLPARGARTKAEAEAQKAADQAKKLIKEILEFLFGKPGESTRSKASRPIKQEIQAEIHDRMSRRDQLDARLARLEAAADAAAEEKARLLADLDGRAAFTRPAAGAPGQPPLIPKI